MSVNPEYRGLSAASKNTIEGEAATSLCPTPVSDEAGELEFEIIEEDSCLQFTSLNPATGQQRDRSPQPICSSKTNSRSEPQLHMSAESGAVTAAFLFVLR
jgi:hypothetical protein